MRKLPYTYIESKVGMCFTSNSFSGFTEREIIRFLVFQAIFITTTLIDVCWKLCKQSFLLYNKKKNGEK